MVICIAAAVGVCKGEGESEACFEYVSKMGSVLQQEADDARSRYQATK